MAVRPEVRILSLCSGIDGLYLGVRLAIPGVRCVAHVEGEAYAAADLVRRMEEGTLDEAFVWSDVRSFDGRPLLGRIHGIIAGYPCQPFSTAGRRKGQDDPRHLWPHVARIVGEVQPAWCFFENVGAHLSLGFDAVHDDLEAMGYAVACGLFTAAEVGAPQRRERLFVLAHRAVQRRPQPQSADEQAGHDWPPTPIGGGGTVPRTASGRRENEPRIPGAGESPGRALGGTEHSPSGGTVDGDSSARTQRPVGTERSSGAVVDVPHDAERGAAGSQDGSGPGGAGTAPGASGSGIPVGDAARDGGDGRQRQGRGGRRVRGQGGRDGGPVVHPASDGRGEGWAADGVRGGRDAAADAGVGSGGGLGHADEPRTDADAAGRSPRRATGEPGGPVGDPAIRRGDVPGIPATDDGDTGPRGQSRPGRDWQSGGPGSGDVPYWPPGPADRDAWVALLAEYPWLAPAVRGPAPTPAQVAQRIVAHFRRDVTKRQTGIVPNPDGLGGMVERRPLTRRERRRKRRQAALEYALARAAESLLEAEPEPGVRGLAPRVPAWVGRCFRHRIDRLRALGNAVVPACAAVAFGVLWFALHGCYPDSEEPVRVKEESGDPARDE